MPAYRIFETETFRKELKKNCSPSERDLIVKKCDEIIYPKLRLEPHFGPQIKKLVNFDPETWRYRIGEFRLFYLIEETEKIIVLSSVRRRKDAYR